MKDELDRTVTGDEFSFSVLIFKTLNYLYIDQKFFQFEITITVLVGSFCFIRIPKVIINI